MPISEEVSKVASEIKERSEINARFNSLEKRIKKQPKIQKLEWTGKPEQFGFVFLELAKKGFISMPSTNGDASYSKFAKVCFDLFEFESGTTLGNLQRAMTPKKNMLSESNKQKFTIPNIADIS